MNLDNLFTWITGIIIAFSFTGNLSTLQSWIWRAQAKVIHESRTSTWGSPRFFKDPKKVRKANPEHSHENFEL